MSEKPFRDIGDISSEILNDRNESSNSTQNLNSSSTTIGSGNNAFFSDSRGSWWGHQSPDKAPICITMKGEIVIRASAMNIATAIKFYDDKGNLCILIGFENE